MNDGFVASNAYAGARSCPYCAHFEEDGHGLSCSFSELQRRALNAEAERDAANDVLGTTKPGRWNSERVLREKAEAERDEARAEAARLANELRTVAERQREACALACEALKPPERSWHDGERSVTRFDAFDEAGDTVRATPLVGGGE